MWSYREDEAAQLRTDRENRRLLPGVKIPEEIAIVTDFAALGEAELVLIAVPSSAVRSVSAQLHGRLAPGAVVVCVSKGFEPETLKRMDEVIAEELPENPCVILSGPSHAEEVAKGIPTTVVAACRDLDMAERVQMTLSGAEAVKQVGMTVEGYTNTKNAYEMGRRLGVEMPITNEVYKVLYEGKDIRQAIADLMGRPRRHESEYTWLQEGNLSR